MKTGSLLLFCVLLNVAKGSSQKIQTGVYERIDTIVTFDPQTLWEEIRIVKVNAVYMDAEFCEPIPDAFMAKRGQVDLSMARELNEMEFRCSGMFQREWAGEWEIQSFNLVLYKANQPHGTWANWGAEFTEEARKGLSGLAAGDLLSFEQVILVHPKEGLKTGGCSLLVK